MKQPKYPRAKCQHFTPTGRRSSRRACAYVPGLPEEMQGLCAGCMGEAMVAYQTEAYAEKLSRKITGEIARLEELRTSSWPQDDVERICKAWLLNMAQFAKRKAKRSALKRSEDFSLAG